MTNQVQSMNPFATLFALFPSLSIFFTPVARAHWHAKAVFITDARLAVLKERVVQRQEPAWSAWQKVQKMANDGLTLKVGVPQQWHVPGAYKDPHVRD